MSKQYVNKMVKLGVIPLHDKKIKPDEADKCLENHATLSYDAQREANAKRRDEDMLFSEKNIPEESVANMSDDEKKKRDQELVATFKKLEDESTKEENDTRPGVGATGAEWNIFKTQQQALNYELDRKVKEGTLMYLDDFKATAEVLLGPLNQGLDNLAFNFKAQFPDIPDEAIQWLLGRTNQLKVDAQNVSL